MNDIEILKEFIKYYETEYFKGKKLNSSIKIIVDEDDIEAIENLIQRNKNLEQIEKEHKEENGRLREKVRKIEEYVKQCDWHNNDVYIGEDILDLLEENEK